ncbi:MAG: 50S ribosomal protein L3 [Nanobdellota archaeon]
MKSRNPRYGSMGVWPRKRAKSENPRIRSWADIKDSKIAGFVGYKVGMTHIHVMNNNKNSVTKGMDIHTPVTIVECPPIKIIGLRTYKKNYYGNNSCKDIYEGADKVTKKRTGHKLSSKHKLDSIKPEEFDNLVLICQSSPEKVSIGKKKPEIFELPMGGSNEDKLNFAKDKMGKEIPLSEVFEAGNVVDIHAITKGKGYQGVIKRFGVSLKESKSEKGQRRVGARSGGWTSQRHMMYRVAQPGQTGYHLRTDYNNQIMMVSEETDKINPVGGFPRYGFVKNTYMLIKGSIPGPKKRFVKLVKGVHAPVEGSAPQIENISLDSKQG